MLFGFSTGALALGDFQLGLRLCREQGVRAVEISALRECELKSLVEEAPRLDLTAFAAVSFHAPSKREQLEENELVDLLVRLANGRHPVVVHPDVIEDVRAWDTLGECLCLENMDKRKPVGRTADELAFFFKQLPQARLCVDLAHARQVDPSMSVAAEILVKFADRITQLHLSDVTSSSKHEPLSNAAIASFSNVASLVPREVVAILESTFCSEEMCIRSELEAAERVFETVDAI